MTAARLPCEHGRYGIHTMYEVGIYAGDCPGGSPITIADLEGLQGSEALRRRLSTVVAAWVPDFNAYARKEFVGGFLTALLAALTPEEGE